MQKQFISSKLALAKDARAANCQTRAKTTHLGNDVLIHDPIVIDESIYKENIRVVPLIILNTSLIGCPFASCRVQPVIFSAAIFK